MLVLPPKAKSAMLLTHRDQLRIVFFGDFSGIRGAMLALVVLFYVLDISQVSDGLGPDDIFGRHPVVLVGERTFVFLVHDTTGTTRRQRRSFGIVVGVAVLLGEGGGGQCCGDSYCLRKY